MELHWESKETQRKVFISKCMSDKEIQIILSLNANSACKSLAGNTVNLIENAFGGGGLFVCLF